MRENNIGNCQPLSSDDWKTLKKLYNMLETFYKATLCTEGNRDHLGRWLPAMEFIYAKVSGFVEEAKELQAEDPKYPWLEAAAEGALAKCKQYYKYADDSPAYYAADILQPHRKWNWLHKRWGGSDKTEPWLADAKNAVREFWEEEYKGKYRTTQLPSQQRSRKNRQDSLQPDFSDISLFMELEEVETTPGDSYQAYIERDPEGKLSIEEVLDYWNSRLLSQPDLARFALDMLALPASSSECERVFSSAKLLISPSRNRVNPDIVEMNECLKSWFAKERISQEGSSAVECASKDSGSESEESGDSDETGDESSSREGTDEEDDV